MSDENDYILVYDYTTMINIETKEYPLTFYQVRLRFNNTSFPVPCRDYLIEPFGYAPVVPVDMPVVDGYVSEGTPEQREDGRWYQKWDVREYTQEEYVAELDRRKLNALENQRFIFENDLSKGISFTFEDKSYKSKVRSFDIGYLLSVKDIAQRKSDEVFTIPTVDEVLTALSSEQAITIANAILDSNHSFTKVYWDQVQDIMEAETLQDIPEMKDTFITE